jgi:hypothetical protein
MKSALSKKSKIEMASSLAFNALYGTFVSFVGLDPKVTYVSDGPRKSESVADHGQDSVLRCAGGRFNLACPAHQSPAPRSTFLSISCLRYHSLTQVAFCWPLSSATLMELGVSTVQIRLLPFSSLNQKRCPLSSWYQLPLK